jgi:hypothetical protein
MSLALSLIQTGSVFEVIDSSESQESSSGIVFRPGWSSSLSQLLARLNWFGGKSGLLRSRIAFLLIYRSMQTENARRNSGVAQSDEDISTMGTDPAPRWFVKIGAPAQLVLENAQCNSNCANQRVSKLHILGKISILFYSCLIRVPISND